MIFAKIRCFLQPKNINQFEEFEVGEAQNVYLKNTNIRSSTENWLDDIRFSTKILRVLKA